MGPTAALTAAAGVTTTLRLGVLVFCNDYRHPAVLARDAATLDLLSDGRLELGLGAGWKADEYAQSGIPFERPGARIDRLADAVATVKATVRRRAGDPRRRRTTRSTTCSRAAPGAATPPSDPHRRWRSAVCSPWPAVRPTSSGSTSTSARGRSIVTAGPTATDDATDQKVAWITEAAGGRVGDIELHTRIHLALVTDDRDAVAEAVAPTLGLTPEQSKHSPHALVGTFERDGRAVPRWRDRWGISAIGLSADALEPLAPLVARLAGT